MGSVLKVIRLPSSQNAEPLEDRHGRHYQQGKHYYVDGCERGGRLRNNRLQQQTNKQSEHHRDYYGGSDRQ